MSQMKTRYNLLEYLLNNTEKTSKELFTELIYNEQKPSRRGYVYESICELLIVTKCIKGLDYEEIKTGRYPAIHTLKNINDILNKNIGGSKDGGTSDITILRNKTLIPFSIKYREEFIPADSDVERLCDQFRDEKFTVAFIVKDKAEVINHSYQNVNVKERHSEVIKNDLLFDETDIKIGLEVFLERFKKVDRVKEFINDVCLLSKRRQLVLKLHQKMSYLKFISNLKFDRKYHVIDHKPRSGKSILMLYISKYLLENNYKKILIMTAIPSTINSFIEDLRTFIDFESINYKIQKEDKFETIDPNFIGIVFSSVQYFKAGDVAKKKETLKNLNFDVIFGDECHLGCATTKTKKNILNVEDLKGVNTRLNIFVSGTPDKTKRYYNVPKNCVYEWKLEDVAYMKNLTEENINIMVSRHGEIFRECIEDYTLNKDYSKCPTQVLLKPLLSSKVIEEIKKYNIKHGTNYGYSISSLLALEYDKKAKKYKEKFEICSTADGKEMLCNVLDSIISNDRNNQNTVMKEVEKIQNKYDSRISNREEPLLFIIYAPTHTGNSTIETLQKTFVKFLEEKNLWTDYYIGYSNSNSDSEETNEEYNNFIKTIMKNTKENNKKGCILILGDKGGTGITYHNNDVTISLDDGHNLDNQKQRFSRCLTEAEGKTIGINVDMNIQRSYRYLLDQIESFKKVTKIEKPNDELLHYLYKNEIFMYNPLQYNNNNETIVAEMEYYKEEVSKIMNEIDVSPILENIVCDDDLREIIKNNWKRKETIEKDPRFEGEQKECPKSGKTKIEIDKDSEEEKKKIKEEESDEKLINQTFEMCKNFLFPLLALLSITFGIYNFQDLFKNSKCKQLILNIFREKKIDIGLNNYLKYTKVMNDIINNNQSIIDSISEIYRHATTEKLRLLIEKNFVPSESERKENAEIPTPVGLIDKMLENIPKDYWKSVNTTFEPCCGKGNFILAIFDKFYEGLSDLFPNKVERCKIIMTECIYYADITHLNEFITTEIMKYHIQSKCSAKVDYAFNSYVGDTLKLNIKKQWNINSFEAIIGNPPYDKGLYKIFITSMLKISNRLLFVVPSNFTANITGKKIVKELKDNGLKSLNFLTRDSFMNKVDIDTLYFLTVKGYNGIITINDDIKINKKEDIINYANAIEYKIFNKVMKQEKMELFKGKNKTLNHNNPKEKDNIKFKKDEEHQNKLLSRLNGGKRLEIYWIGEYKEDNTDNFKFVLPRSTASYKSINRLSDFNNDIVYNMCVEKETILSDAIMYILLENKSDYEHINKYLMRHKLIRFIFIRQNKYSELTKGLFAFIPKIPIDIIKKDKIYEYLKFTEEEIFYIEETFWNNCESNNKTDSETEETSSIMSYTEESLSKYTVPELKKIAKEKGIKGYSRLNKPDIIKKLI